MGRVKDVVTFTFRAHPFSRSDMKADPRSSCLLQHPMSQCPLPRVEQFLPLSQVCDLKSRKMISRLMYSQKPKITGRKRSGRPKPKLINMLQRLNLRPRLLQRQTQLRRPRQQIRMNQNWTTARPRLQAPPQRLRSKMTRFPL